MDVSTIEDMDNESDTVDYISQPHFEDMLFQADNRDAPDMTSLEKLLTRYSCDLKLEAYRNGVMKYGNFCFTNLTDLDIEEFNTAFTNKKPADEN